MFDKLFTELYPGLLFYNIMYIPLKTKIFSRNNLPRNDKKHCHPVLLACINTRF